MNPFGAIICLLTGHRDVGLPTPRGHIMTVCLRCRGELPR